jgi:membrane protease subunit HflK
MVALLAASSRGCKIRAPALFFSANAPINVRMERLGGIFDRIVLAMAGKRGPWGGGPKDEGDGERDSGSEGETPPSADKPDKGRGPRNPWLPGDGGSGEEPRRSANI